MNRRQLFGFMAVAPLVPAILAELLLPKRTIFLPPRGGWAAPADIVWKPTPFPISIGYLMSFEARPQAVEHLGVHDVFAVNGESFRIIAKAEKQHLIEVLARRESILSDRLASSIGGDP